MGERLRKRMKRRNSKTEGRKASKMNRANKALIVRCDYVGCDDYGTLRYKDKRLCPYHHRLYEDRDFFIRGDL